MSDISLNLGTPDSGDIPEEYVKRAGALFDAGFLDNVNTGSKIDLVAWGMWFQHIQHISSEVDRVLKKRGIN